jgi:outer membrane protein OmpA-like peptidoglycan-associated protein
MAPRHSVSLDQLAGVLAANPDGMVMVAAHTFTEPTSEANLALSARQANAVAGYLAARGVDKARLMPVAHGDPPVIGFESTSVYVTFSVMHG